MSADDQGYAEIALDRAMERLLHSADPWDVPEVVIAKVRKLFELDFRTEITDYDRFVFWRDAIDRLFGYVGSVSAFIAELRLGSVLKPSGSVTYHDVTRAVMIVRVICPNDPPDSAKVQWRLCMNVLREQDSFVGDLRALFRELTDLEP